MIYCTPISNKIGTSDSGDGEEDWHVDGSDDEKYDSSKSGTGLWQPSAEDILSMFDKLEKEKVIELKWVCPGRRAPKTEEEEEDTDATQDPNADNQPEEMEEEAKPAQPTEFDFEDDEFDTSTKVTPRRTPGSKTPKSQKKVARMDKVLQHIFIERKQIAAEKEKRRLAINRSPRAGPRPGMTRMSPGTSPMHSSTSPGSSSQNRPSNTSSAAPGLVTTPLRPPPGEGTPVIHSPANAATTASVVTPELSATDTKVTEDSAS